MKTEERQVFKNVLTETQLVAIEPLIDELMRQARDTADIETIAIPFHAIVQLIVVLKAYEWHEPRPGFVHCAECKIEFHATPIAGRHHRRECRYGELLKFLQAKIQTHEGSKNHAVSNDAPVTTR
jgi:hypothetical protein